MARNDYDKGVRYLAKQLDAEGVLRWLLPAVVFQKWRRAGWVDAQRVAYPGEPDRRCDTVARFKRKDGDAPPAAVVIEFLSRPRGEARERQAEYQLRLRRERPYQRDPLVRYSVAGVLVHLTGPAQPEQWSMQPPDFADLGLSAKDCVVTLREMSASAALADIEAKAITWAVLALVPCMAGADSPSVVADWRRLALPLNEEQRGDLGGLARLFAEVAGRSEIWGPGLEDWNVERSPFVLSIEKRGEKRGEERGEQRAMDNVRNTMREKLLNLLRSRFRDAPLADDLVTAVNAQMDAGTLADWLTQVPLAKTHDEVRATLGLG